jgi:hypothetical protein
MGKKGTGESKGSRYPTPISCVIATATKSALVESTGRYARYKTFEFDNMLPLSL